MPRTALFAGLVLAGTIGLVSENPATKAAPRSDANWKQRHESCVERAKQGNCDVLFVGDSITEGWAGREAREIWNEQFASWKPVNFGISSDRTQHVLWRITEGRELEGLEPKVVVLMIGTNNVGRDSPEQIAEGIESIVASFRRQRPKAKILLLGVFPRCGKRVKDLKDQDVAAADEQHKSIPAINAILANLDDGKSVRYLDIGQAFLNESGGLPKSVMPDYLHLSKEGYARWASAIKLPVEDLMSMK